MDSNSQSLDFDSIKQVNVYGMEYWSARDLMPLLGYSQWRRFEDALQRAMTSCEQSENVVPDHFADAGKMVEERRRATKKRKLKAKEQDEQTSLFDISDEQN